MVPAIGMVQTICRVHKDHSIINGGVCPFRRLELGHSVDPFTPVQQAFGAFSSWHGQCTFTYYRLWQFWEVALGIGHMSLGAFGQNDRGG